MMHVTVMLLSYATLILGSVLSIAFIFVSEVQSKIPSQNSLQNSLISGLSFSTSLAADSDQSYASKIDCSKDEAYWQPQEQYSKIKTQFFETKKKNLLNKMDQLSFRAIGIGFPFLTIGILSGSVWANEAWGSYWSWDPKETWSLVTWMIFAIYLHLRLTQKWNGLKSAILATVGFFIVWICFLGVNFLGKGLHSYGWFH